MGILDRGYIPGHEALVHCIRGAAWNPIDHLANVHSAILIREGVDEDPTRAWAFNVDHYRMTDAIWASVDGAGLPDAHGSVHVTVLHADVNPATRICDACDTQVGNGKGADGFAPWARPRPIASVRKLGALPV